MLGWFKADADRASFSKRLRRPASEPRSAGRTLIATSRLSRASRARHTSPMPPAPRREITSYGPSRPPAERLTRLFQPVGYEKIRGKLRIPVDIGLAVGRRNHLYDPRTAHRNREGFPELPASRRKIQPRDLEMLGPARSHDERVSVRAPSDREEIPRE